MASRWMIILALAVTGCAPTPDPLSPGWNEILPGGETSCSDGTPYRFWARPGNPDKLMIYLDGGGACWFRGNCDPDMKPTYTINLDGHHPEQSDGVFNFARTDNPLGDYTAVYAPYCSADVHIGASDTTYPPERDDQVPLTVRHRGFANMQAVLSWTYANVRNPATVFVAGSSAGSIPSPYYAMKVAERYTAARIVQLGDGSGGYRRVGDSTLPHESWGTLPVLKAAPAFADLDDETFNYEALYIRAAASAPQVQFAAYDAAEDGVQKQFLTLTGVNDVSLLSLIDQNQADIRRANPGFRSYIAGGDSHTILRRPELYTFRVDGVPFRDWLEDLVNGAPVTDAKCNPCAEAELTEASPGS